MPLSKENQALWMREYRAKKRGELGITAAKTRDFANSVIPKQAIEDTSNTWLDADGNPVYDD